MTDKTFVMLQQLGQDMVDKINKLMEKAEENDLNIMLNLLASVSSHFICSSIEDHEVRIDALDDLCEMIDDHINDNDDFRQRELLQGRKVAGRYSFTWGYPMNKVLNFIPENNSASARQCP